MSSSRLGVLVLNLLFTATLLGGAAHRQHLLAQNTHPPMPVSTTAAARRPPGGRLDQRRIPGRLRTTCAKAIYASGWGDGFEQCR
ncbi:hypothetical protein P4132_32140 [Pseudomonas aeruginosa]|nr:hypothetical protein [Pseudomonas aeruginosa]